MSTVDTLKEAVAKFKEKKSVALTQALKVEDDGEANKLLYLAESLALAEAHSQAALVRALRLERCT